MNTQHPLASSPVVSGLLLQVIVTHVLASLYTVFCCPHYCLCVHCAVWSTPDFCLVKLPSFLSQVTSLVVTGNLIPLLNTQVKASISTFCRCHNNSLSVSGVEEILLLASTLHPDEVQFCCCCCCCCCWSCSKLKSYGFHLCLPPPIPVWCLFLKFCFSTAISTVLVHCKIVVFSLLSCSQSKSLLEAKYFL